MRVTLGTDFLGSMKVMAARWLRDDSGNAMIEAGLLLPLCVTMLMGVYDIGQGLTTNQKVVGASQIMGDLIARDRSVTMTGLQDIIKAGELALQPYDTAPFGYDIVSVQFDDAGDPEILWRVTENTEENDDAVESTKGLGEEGDGLVIVTTSYRFTPFFSDVVLDDIEMKEVAFLHGRRSATVACADCPG